MNCASVVPGSFLTGRKLIAIPQSLDYPALNFSTILILTFQWVILLFLCLPPLECQHKEGRDVGCSLMNFQ
jgi:hypothetical protein